MVEKERIREFENAVNEMKWDVIGLSEVMKEGEVFKRRRSGNYAYHYKKTKGYKALIFIIKEPL